MQLRVYPDPILTQLSLPYVIGSKIGDMTLEEFSTALMERCQKLAGHGLAAVQMGYLVRIAAIDPRDRSDPFIAINPKIVEYDGDPVPMTEACLSLPFVFGDDSPRYQSLTVSYTTIKGVEVTASVGGALSQIFQHELDHMDGKLWVDRLSFQKRQMYIKKYQKQTKKIERWLERK